MLALVLAIGACDSTQPTDPTGTPEVSAVAEGISLTPSFSKTFRGGIPFGTYHLPKAEYGKALNGSVANTGPNLLLSYLEAAQQSGTRLMLSLVGGESNYRNKDHSFSLAMWKAKVDRYRGIDISDYIADGTIIGHYLIDEPNDRTNWGGSTISPATLDEMARYSKEIWPSMLTIVRTWPSYLQGQRYKYLDAAWAQYSARYGASSQRLPIRDFMAKNVRESKAAGLGLVVGMNLLAGGGSSGLEGFYPGQVAPSAAELREWGSVMLDDSYPCAFISWKYDQRYLSRSDISSAMSYLTEKAQSRSSKSCRGAASGNPDREDDDEDNEEENPTRPEPKEEEPPPVVVPPPPPIVVTPAPPAGEQISLTVTGAEKIGGSSKHKRRHMTLLWSGAPGSSVDVYRNGARVKVTKNSGKYVNAQNIKGPATYEYKVCAAGTSTCSNTAAVTFK
jgi:hypothetical protein